jgi:hypothetical protein
MQYSLKSAIKCELSQSQSQYHKHNFTLILTSPEKFKKCLHSFLKSSKLTEALSGRRASRRMKFLSRFFKYKIRAALVSFDVLRQKL